MPSYRVQNFTVNLRHCISVVFNVVLSVAYSSVFHLTFLFPLLDDSIFILFFPYAATGSGSERSCSWSCKYLPIKFWSHFSFSWCLFLFQCQCSFLFCVALSVTASFALLLFLSSLLFPFIFTSSFFSFTNLESGSHKLDNRRGFAILILFQTDGWFSWPEPLSDLSLFTF